MDPLLVARHLRKTYLAGTTRVDAVDDISLELGRGEFVAVVGPSGCGKSTLLHLCGGMDRPTGGLVTLDGVDLGRLDDEKLAGVRRTRIGFVFQAFNLLPTLTLAENIALPLLLEGLPESTAMAAGRDLAARVGLEARLSHYPAQLSGGEQQRGAIARALVHRPALVIADEPTGSLDTGNGEQVLALLEALNDEFGVTLLLATHAPELARAADRALVLRDGRLRDDDAAV